MKKAGIYLKHLLFTIFFKFINTNQLQRQTITRHFRNNDI
jgi:hypothetical protein